MTKEGRKKAKKQKKKGKHLSDEDLAAADLHVGDVKAGTKKIDNKVYVKELARLQIELVKMQEWIKHEKLRVVVISKGATPPARAG